MIKQVFTHVYVSYKEVRSVWLGFLSKLIENFTSKCLLSILFAKLIVALVEGNSRAAIILINTTTGVLIVTAIINSLGDHFFVKYTDQRYKVLAGDFHSKLLTKDVAYFERESVGKLNTLFRDHLDGTIRVIRLLRGEVLSFLSALFFPVLALLFYNVTLAIAVLVIGLIEFLITNWTANKVKLERKGALAVYKTLTAEVTDQILNITVVKASGREDSFKQSVINLAAEEEALFTHRHKFEAFTEFVKATMVAIGLGFTLWLITKENTSTKATAELLVLAILYLLQINLAISNFPDLFKTFHEHIDRVYSTLPILSSQWESFNECSSEANQPQTPDVSFDHVDYSYRDESGVTLTQVFENFSLEVKAGTHCAVMGKSGSGKSTLAHLLMRFDDVTAGGILVGGIDIREYDIKYFRECLSYVPSQPILFNRTIRENIILYSPNASQDEIISACECAQVNEFISSLENGYESVVSERGGNLSSGQKQRIAIARALLKKEAKIFIFDEITSALDEGAADNLVKSIKDRLVTKTVFFMTHNADLGNRMDYKVLL
jgi:ABC-type bacteriocin/lantibiotic exporter with double-glycine peptidase domain